MIRRILDYFGLASYPAHPRIPRRPDLAIGVNVHADGSNFAEIKTAGFDTVVCDWWPGDDAWFDTLFLVAKADGLKVFVTGFPKDGGPIAEQARELFSRHGSQIDFCAVRNEPDLAKFYDGTLADLVLDVNAVGIARQAYAPMVKIVAPCFASLGSSTREDWRDKEIVLKHLWTTRLPYDVIGQHIYRDTPDAVLRYYKHICKVYRNAGWTQKFFISEYGWRSPKLSQEKQARYVTNTMAMLAKEPDVCGIAPYVLNDDVAAKDFFGIRGKKAWQRVSDGLR